MSYLVLARKYRPQTFEEVVGQEHIGTTLMNSILSNRVAHAYLFAGSRGVGKTSMARIFSKVLNCPKAKKGVPCNKCEICQTISQGSDMDVIEIDGASNRGVEDISILRDGTKYMPSRGKYKIYIIDEVHMLTKHAFNALLKTLEEPPDHVKFIFATTEPNKVPDTILSRCQRFDFKRISPADIVVRLGQIAEKEGVAVEEKALFQIAQAARGGMRDSQSLLDQAFSFCEGDITSEKVSQVLGILPQEKVVSFLQSLLDKQLPEALTFLDEIYWAGVDLREFLDQCLEGLRNLMVISLLGDKGRDLSGSALGEEWQGLVSKVTIDELLMYLQVLTATREKLKLDTQPRILIEMAFVYLSRLEHFSSLAGLLENRPALPSGGAPRSIESKSPSPDSRSPSGPSPQKSPPPKGERGNSSPPPAPEPPKKIEGNVKSNWGEILKALQKKYPGHATSLGKGKLMEEKGGILKLAYSPSHEIHREMVEEKAAREKIEEFLKEITGQTLHLKFVKTEDQAVESQKLSIDLPPMIFKALDVFSGELILPEKD